MSSDFLTVHELAARTGLPVRTIRYYGGLGLIPPPELRGRVAYYGPAHLARLELVRDLQGLGFTLAAIERHLAAIPHDRSPEELALHRALLAPWQPEESVELTRDELAELAGRPISKDDLDRLCALGAVEAGADGRVHSPSVDTLRLGLTVLDLDMPFDVLVTAQQIVARHTSAMAEELFGLFGERVLRSYREAGRPAAARERLLAVLGRLKPVTMQGVVTNFQLAVNRLIRQSVPADGTAAREARS